ncbi:hypothetical protein JCM10212_005910 [Sporobolomyces blumeae]
MLVSPVALFAALTVFGTAAVAQISSDAPACIARCFNAKLQEAPTLAPGVASGDLAGLCQSSAFVAAYDTCLNDNCQGDDVQRGQDLGNEACAGASSAASSAASSSSNAAASAASSASEASASATSAASSVTSALSSATSALESASAAAESSLRSINSAASASSASVQSKLESAQSSISDKVASATGSAGAAAESGSSDASVVRIGAATLVGSLLLSLLA